MKLVILWLIYGAVIALFPILVIALIMWVTPYYLFYQMFNYYQGWAFLWIIWLVISYIIAFYAIEYDS